MYSQHFLTWCQSLCGNKNGNCNELIPLYHEVLKSLFYMITISFYDVLRTLYWHPFCLYVNKEDDSNDRFFFNTVIMSLNTEQNSLTYQMPGISNFSSCLTYETIINRLRAKCYTPQNIDFIWNLYLHLFKISSCLESK